MEFSLANLDTPDGDRAALHLPGGYVRLDHLGGADYARGLRGLLDAWDSVFPALRGLAERCRGLDSAAPGFIAAGAARPTTPVRYPNKLVCVGGVYRDHLREFNLPAQRWPKMPIFTRPPTTSLVGPGATVPIPPDTREFDWEIELAVVMGAPLTDGDLDGAAAAIAGYAVGIDLTCRDLLDRGSPTGVDLIRAKAQDNMAPLGPALVPAAFVGDPQALGLRLYVNGEIKQNGTTADMLYSVYEQVAMISRVMSLEPGDVIFTGSCAGSGASIGQYLAPGDHIRAEIERIGILDVRIGPPRTRPANFRDALYP
jgi:2-keto-4-pentenoate hydratase/2-oxohepta-3-ene-1,7-dioic acid hydratase in catechol pathway